MKKPNYHLTIPALAVAALFAFLLAPDERRPSHAGFVAGPAPQVVALAAPDDTGAMPPVAVAPPGSPVTVDAQLGGGAGSEDLLASGLELGGWSLVDGAAPETDEGRPVIPNGRSPVGGAGSATPAVRAPGGDGSFALASIDGFGAGGWPGTPQSPGRAAGSSAGAGPAGSAAAPSESAAAPNVGAPAVQPPDVVAGTGPIPDTTLAPPAWQPPAGTGNPPTPLRPFLPPVVPTVDDLAGGGPGPDGSGVPPVDVAVLPPPDVLVPGPDVPVLETGPLPSEQPVVPPRAPAAVAEVPEPTGLALVGVALLGLAASRRKKR